MIEPMSQITAQEILSEMRRLGDMIAPWLSLNDMATRYKCTTKTISAMELRGDIPRRTKGRWLRSEVAEWEMAQSKKARATAAH